MTSPIDDLNSGTISKASNLQIQANNKLSGTAKLDLKSSKSILIDANNGVFIANSGTIFIAEIGGCIE